jgi:pyruvate formate lyase activating enzyme
MVKTPDTIGTIFKIKRFSIHDGPGIRTSVFLKGCPLNCIWCHSPEGIDRDITIWHNPAACIGCGSCVDSCPEKALALVAGEKNVIAINRGKCRLSGNCVKVCPTNAIQFTGYTISVKDVVNEIEKDILFYEESGGGVTLTGGEPLYQPDFTKAILMECKNKDINTAIETSLFSDRRIIEKILDYTDLFIIDMKIFNNEDHLKFTGKSNRIIKDNFCYTAASGKKIIVRIPMIGMITDTSDNIKALTEFVREQRSDIDIEHIRYNPLTKNNYDRLGLPFLIK